MKCKCDLIFYRLQLAVILTLVPKPQQYDIRPIRIVNQNKILIYVVP